MSIEKLDYEPKNRFYTSMIIWSWIFFAISSVEKNSSTSSKWLYTTFWIATILCLLLAINEYIQLSRLNAPKYVKSDFEKLVWSYLCKDWPSYQNMVIDYFMNVTRSDKIRLIHDFEVLIHTITHEIRRMKLRLKKLEFNTQCGDNWEGGAIIENQGTEIVYDRYTYWDPIRYLRSELDSLNWTLNIYLILIKKMKSILKTSFI